MSEGNEKSEPTETRAEVEAVAMRLLARRDHGRRELARKLCRRGFDDLLVEKVIEDCAQRGYLDDARFADHQSAILVRKCWGPRQIRKKLRARGVDDKFIDAALDNHGDNQIWQTKARQRLHARFGPAEELEQRDLQRAFRHLRYRGYHPQLIRRLLFD